MIINLQTIIFEKVILTQWYLFSGKLQIAEVNSRFTSIKEFITLVSNFGFTLDEKVSSTINFEYKIIIRLL